MIASYRAEQTGNPVLDRIQAALRACIDAVRVLDARLPALHVLALQAPFTTTSAVMQPTALTFPVRDKETWLIEYWGFAGVTGSANGMKYAIGAPPNSTVSGMLDSSLTSATDDAQVTISAPNTLTSAVHTVAGGSRADRLTALVKVVGNGSITLMAASTTSSNTTTIAAQACMRAMRYTEA